MVGVKNKYCTVRRASDRLSINLSAILSSTDQKITRERKSRGKIRRFPSSFLPTFHHRINFDVASTSGYTSPLSLFAGLFAYRTRKIGGFASGSDGAEKQAIMSTIASKLPFQTSINVPEVFFDHPAGDDHGE